MNGYTAADMSTAAANGFRDGLAAQPAAAQEAVVWVNGRHLEECKLMPMVESMDEPGKMVPRNVAGSMGKDDYSDTPLYAAPVAATPVVPNGKLVGWWNGIAPGYDGQGIPSIRLGADAENSGHDIPLYDGYNPVHYQQPTPAAPGIDLMHLRKLANEVRVTADDWTSRDVPGNAVLHHFADQLGALIDASPKGGSDAPADMHVTDLAALLWRELSNNGFLIGGPDFESVAHPIDKARFIAIAEIVQDALQATSAEVGECHCRAGRYGCEPDCPSQQPTSHGAGVSG